MSYYFFIKEDELANGVANIIVGNIDLVDEFNNSIYGNTTKKYMLDYVDDDDSVVIETVLSSIDPNQGEVSESTWELTMNGKFDTIDKIRNYLINIIGWTENLDWNYDQE